MKRKIGDIVKLSNGTFKVIGFDSEGKCVLTKTTETVVEVENEEPKPRRTRTRGV
jgi:hypothetical protein